MRFYFLAETLAFAAALRTQAFENARGFCSSEIALINGPSTGETIFPREQHDERLDEQLDITKELVFDVFVHVLGKPEEVKNRTEFLLTRDEVEHQIEVVNQAFNSFNVSFKLMHVDWTVSEGLVRPGLTLNQLRLPMLPPQLHQGNASTLNIYFLSATEGDGGIAYSDFEEGNPSKTAMRGIILNTKTVPGGSDPQFNMGLTAVHEIGHWLGLNEHDETVPGNCFQKGQCSSEAGCTSHMSYAPDMCKVQFRPAHISFMRSYAKQVLAGRFPWNWTAFHSPAMFGPVQFMPGYRKSMDDLCSSQAGENRFGVSSDDCITYTKACLRADASARTKALSFDEIIACVDDNFLNRPASPSKPAAPAPAQTSSTQTPSTQTPATANSNLWELRDKLCATGPNGKGKHGLDKAGCYAQVSQCTFEARKSPDPNWDTVVKCMDTKFLPAAH